MEDSNRFEAAQTTEDRYRLLVEAITDCAIYMLDREGHVTSWNPGARRFKDYEANEIIGRHFSTFTSTLSGPRTSLPRRWQRPSAPAASSAKAGTSGRTARSSGPMLSSMRSARRTGIWSASLKLPAT
jgi:PAS domain-containing protein